MPKLVAAVVAAASIAAVAAGQQPIRSGARTVAVFATVTDGTGRLLTDLKKQEFEIYDNGTRQEISVFSSDIQPITVVMMLDRSGSMRANFRIVEVAAEEFVRRLLPADKARIGSFAVRIQVDPREFTSSTDELIRILRTELQPEGPTPLWNAVNVAMTALLRQDGRRVVLVFTDGQDAPMGNNNVSLREVTRRAQQEDVMIYAIGLAGRGPAPGGWGRSAPGGFRGPRTRSTIQKPDEGLLRIATETGGGYFELTSVSDLGSTFARVADELHRQYAMGFTPSAFDDKTHRLEVRSTRPGVTVRARKSYVATRER